MKMFMNKANIFAILGMAFFLSCSEDLKPIDPPCTASSNTTTHYCSEGIMKEYGLLTDNRSNPSKTYRTVVIGSQTWMAQNLNYNASGSKCHGDNSGGDSENKCNTYGRLYNWEAAMDICPAGWHLPSRAEWEVMTIYIGGAATEGKKLKAAGGWNIYDGVSGNGMDEYGFSALPGSYGDSSGFFLLVGYYGNWWTSSETGGYNEAFIRSMSYDEEAEWTYDDKSFLLSVRCVRN